MIINLIARSLSSPYIVPAEKNRDEREQKATNVRDHELFNNRYSRSELKRTEVARTRLRRRRSIEHRRLPRPRFALTAPYEASRHRTRPLSDPHSHSSYEKKAFPRAFRWRPSVNNTDKLSLAAPDTDDEIARRRERSAPKLPTLLGGNKM